MEGMLLMECYINDYLTNEMISKKEQNEDLPIVLIYNPNTKKVKKHIKALKKAYLEWYDKIEFKEIPNKNIVDLDKIYLTTEMKPFVMPCTPFEVAPMEPLEWLKRSVRYETLFNFVEKAVVIDGSEE